MNTCSQILKERRPTGFSTRLRTGTNDRDIGGNLSEVKSTSEGGYRGEHDLGLRMRRLRTGRLIVTSTSVSAMGRCGQALQGCAVHPPVEQPPGRTESPASH